MEYFLSIAGERSGPFTQFQLIERIREGSLTGTELAWQKGAPEWRPLKSLEEFVPYWPLTPEQIAQAAEARRIARVALDTPQPWLRFWARTMDYVWFGMACGLLASVVLSDQKAWLGNSWTMQLMGFLTHALFIPVEAWCLSQYGTTPGKSLLRIQVSQQGGGFPTFQQALKRALLVYVKGIALGITLPALFTMSLARIRLVQTSTTSWDRDCQTRVEHGEPELWRFLLLSGMVFAMMVAMAVAYFLLHHQELMEAVGSRLPK